VRSTLTDEAVCVVTRSEIRDGEAGTSRRHGGPPATGGPVTREREREDGGPGEVEDATARCCCLCCFLLLLPTMLEIGGGPWRGKICLRMQRRSYRSLQYSIHVFYLEIISIVHSMLRNESAPFSAVN
jgi:hypothetical protein